VRDIDSFDAPVFYKIGYDIERHASPRNGWPPSKFCGIHFHPGAWAEQRIDLLVFPSFKLSKHIFKRSNSLLTGLLCNIDSVVGIIGHNADAVAEFDELVFRWMLSHFQFRERPECLADCLK